jgi:hypothetical protein
MRLNRPPDVASNPEPAGGHRAGAGAVRTLSVVAGVAAALALGALPATAATHATTKHATKTTISIPKTAYTYTDVTFAATVTSSGGGTPTGTVKFLLDGTKQLCKGTLSKGKASCVYKFIDAATKTIVASYGGDSTHNGSSASATIVVSSPPPTVYDTSTTITNPNPETQPAGEAFTIYVTVASLGGGSTPTGTVDVASVYPPETPPEYACSFTLTDGSGSCSVTPPVGSYGFAEFEANYLGDATHNPSESYGEHKLINPDTTTTTAEAATGTAGTAVTLTADVTDEGGGNILAGYSDTPDNVSFSVNGTVVCAASPLEWNATTLVNYATCSYTPPAAGDYTIVASFLGDEYNYPSTSAAATLTVTG